MILSHKYKFIFIKTRKTAGTSLEIALSKFVGPEDVVTPTLPEDEEVRRALGFVPPQNFVKRPGSYRAADLKYILKGLRRRALSSSRKPVLPQFFGHIPAADIRAFVPTTVWNEYFKFAGERNPWDLAVSLYFWMRGRSGRDEEFESFLARGGARIGCNARLYCIDDRPVIDDVVLYHDMAENLGRISHRLGLPENLHDVAQSIRTKSSFRPSSTSDYRSLYSEDAKAIVREQYAKEIDLFGFEF